MNTITIEYAPFDCWTEQPVNDWTLLAKGEETIIFRQPPPCFGIDDINGMKVPMSVEAFMFAYWKWRNGMDIQEAFKNLPDDARNFLQTGITPDIWDLFYGED
jgi:hypothetical protein